jgi:outer membrane lipoprotein SlyB
MSLAENILRKVLLKGAFVNTRIRLLWAAALTFGLAACVQEPGFYTSEDAQTAPTSPEFQIKPAQPKAPNHYDGYAIPKPITCKKDQEGAVTGTVLGALIGGFIGHQVPEQKEDKAGGTAVGAMLGAIIGRMIGASADNETKCQPMDGVLDDSLQVIEEDRQLEA